MRGKLGQLCFAIALLTTTATYAQTCTKTTIVSPAPFMGNHDELFQLADGSIGKDRFEYSYLYAYYPPVTLYKGKLLVGGIVLNVVIVGGIQRTSGEGC